MRRAGRGLGGATAGPSRSTRRSATRGAAAVGLSSEATGQRRRQVGGGGMPPRRGARATSTTSTARVTTRSTGMTWRVAPNGAGTRARGAHRVQSSVSTPRPNGRGVAPTAVIVLAVATADRARQRFARQQKMEQIDRRRELRRRAIGREGRDHIASGGRVCHRRHDEAEAAPTALAPKTSTARTVTSVFPWREDPVLSQPVQKRRELLRRGARGAPSAGFHCGRQYARAVVRSVTSRSLSSAASATKADWPRISHRRRCHRHRP